VRGVLEVRKTTEYIYAPNLSNLSNLLQPPLPPLPPPTSQPLQPLQPLQAGLSRHYFYRRLSFYRFDLT
jgi:hypothetical protein